MENVFLIVGLGNPGADYAKTRHNAGFLLVEKLAARWKSAWKIERKFQARVSRAERGGKTILLAEPQTFMNLSGESVGALLRFYQLPLERMLVVVDDADLPLGEIRLRPGGGTGGHHGLESVMQHARLARRTRGCGSGSGARTRRGRLPATCWAGSAPRKTRCWKKFWNGRPASWNAGWTPEYKRR